MQNGARQSSNHGARSCIARAFFLVTTALACLWAVTYGLAHLWRTGVLRHSSEEAWLLEEPMFFFFYVVALATSLASVATASASVATRPTRSAKMLLAVCLVIVAWTIVSVLSK